MQFDHPPSQAAWRLQDALNGFEVVFLHPTDDGYRAEGTAAAVEEGAAWAVSYSIDLDAGWVTRSARATGRSAKGPHERTLEAVGEGRWRVDGEAAPHLDGCLDVDLESSAFTNALPAHRLALEPGDRAEAPAAYVRARDLAVERLEQSYARVADDNGHQAFDYVSPAFDFRCRLVYDESGLVLEYPGIAVRNA